MRLFKESQPQETTEEIRDCLSLWLLLDKRQVTFDGENIKDLAIEWYYRYNAASWITIRELEQYGSYTTRIQKKRNSLLRK